MCEYTMTDGAKTEISNAEFNVLEALWEQFPATSTELVERLNKQKEWHEKTVRTLLSRLVKKQVINYQQEGRHYKYYPLIAREDYAQKEAKSFVGRLFNGKVAPLVAGFSTQNSLSKEDVQELKEFITQWEKDND